MVELWLTIYHLSTLVKHRCPFFGRFLIWKLPNKKVIRKGAGYARLGESTMYGDITDMNLHH